MTGEEFKAHLAKAGFNQKEFAHLMGAHRQTIGNVCKSPKVDLCWVYALAGLVASKSADVVTDIIKDIDQNPQ